ncbi:MAG: putative glycoside hydrolase [Armatimonadota bacterium]|nr:putative glycoside hydrolase [Armatimonadota bacterium]
MERPKLKNSPYFVVGGLLLIAAGGFTALGVMQTRTQVMTTPTKLSRTEASEKKEAQKPKKELFEARGLHITGWIAGGKKSFGKIVDLVNNTELNALCIDVKDSDGVVSYDTDVPLERQIKASRHCMANPERVLKLMSDNKIYPIARIVVFKDPILAEGKHDMAVHNANGGIWRDHAGVAWANPYSKAVWDYNIDIAIDAAKRGFKEIQWDYVRFPSDGRTSACIYPGKDGRNESEVIRDFLKYARERLEPYGVVMSADIFGLTSLVSHDMGIGQTIKMIAENVDYICPMAYPSHYARHEYGIPNPNVAPYETIRLSLGDHLEEVQKTKAKVRPWLQDFSLYGVHYGRAEIIAQRRAAAEMGLTEFILWNPRCVYTESALSTDPEKPPKEIAAALKSKPFRVVLKKAGPDKEKVRALVEKTVGKEKVDRILKSLPAPVATNLSWANAGKLASELKSAGARVDVR